VEVPVRTHRFMLLASARTGSNLLLSLLSSHPSIKTYGELFKLDALSRDNLAEALDDPVMYLRKRVYKVPRPDVSAVGFKMFYYHLRKEYLQAPTEPFYALHHMHDKAGTVAALIDTEYEWPTLYEKFTHTWDFLLDDHALSVIHLKRYNMLHTLISLKTAFRNNQWWNLDGKTAALTQMYLDPEECRQCFETWETLATTADTMFERHRTLDVAYEDMVTNRQETLSRIFDFLNVPRRPVATRLRKQIVAPASHIVTNYRELRQYFRDTRWTRFFEYESRVEG
jgi:LPS sulfotransferase NodH